LVDHLRAKRAHRSDGQPPRHPDPYFGVHWQPTLAHRDFPYAHDRFAIVDDQLWHFGATVGGGHGSLTAASGPWPAAPSGFVDLFDRLWQALWREPTLPEDQDDVDR
jgi:hypothetical protein